MCADLGLSIQRLRAALGGFDLGRQLRRVDWCERLKATESHATDALLHTVEVSRHIDSGVVLGAS